MKTVKFSTIRPGQTYTNKHGRWRCERNSSGGGTGGIARCLEHNTVPSMVGRDAHGIRGNQNVNVEG